VPPIVQLVTGGNQIVGNPVQAMTVPVTASPPSGSDRITLYRAR
jgi:hypothetical protein